MQPCPLCNQIPDDIYHLIHDCKFTKKMWKKLETTLLKIINIRVTNHEKAFGLQHTSKKTENAVILRNWLTFTLRHCIMQEERKAHYRKNTVKHEQNFIIGYRRKISEEAKVKELNYKYTGREEQFRKIITSNQAVACRKEDGSYEIKCII